MHFTNEVFRHNYPRVKLIATERIALQKEARQLEARLSEMRRELSVVQAEEQECIDLLAVIRPQPFYSRELPRSSGSRLDFFRGFGG